MTSIEIHDLALEESGGLGRISLTVPPGATVGVVGHDQVALTRLIRACAGLQPTPPGTVRVCGVDVGGASRRELLQLHRKVGYVSIAGGLLSNMTLRQNVELALRYHRVAGEVEIGRQAEALLSEVGLAQVADERASLLPAELQKCAAYVRALGCEPDVFLVEDPSAFLHPHGRAAIERLHGQMRARGTTVLVADDDVGFAGRLVESLYELSDGTLRPIPS